MKIETLKTLLTLLTLCLVQAIVLNNIRIFGCATPLLYIYLILNLRRNEPKAVILLWGFVLGIIIDTFSNTPGLATSALTFISLMQPYLLRPFIPRDSADDLKPSFQTLGTTRYTYYTIITTLLYSLLFFTLEQFSFFNLLFWVQCVVGSSVLTIALILAIEKVKS